MFVKGNETETLSYPPQLHYVCSMAQTFSGAFAGGRSNVVVHDHKRVFRCDVHLVS